MTHRAYVIGKPLGHSLSPHLHNAAFQACGIDGHFEAVELDEADLPSWSSSMRRPDTYGCCVTVPYKERIIQYLNEIEGDATLCGAVNTVRVEAIRGGPIRLVGTNTDTHGFRRSLRDEADTSLHGKRVVILGAGGAARAIAVVALQDGASELVVLNRHVDRAQTLLSHLAPLIGSTRVRAGQLEGTMLAGRLERADVLVQATSVGLRSWETPIDPNLISPASLVVDIVYNPAVTALLAGAQARGARILGGLGMLVYQAAVAFELWTGVQAPVTVMRAAAEAELARALGA